MTTDAERRAAARDRLLRRRRALTGGLTVVTLGATGAVAGMLAKPVARRLPVSPALTADPAAAPRAKARAVVPRPKRTVYVRLPATAPRRATAPLPATRVPAATVPRAARVAPPAPVRQQQPPATTSSGS
jgi:hypothetical protein